MTLGENSPNLVTLVTIETDLATIKNIAVVAIQPRKLVRRPSGVVL
jgi:hypothetical protein